MPLQQQPRGRKFLFLGKWGRRHLLSDHHSLEITGTADWTTKAREWQNWVYVESWMQRQKLTLLTRPSTICVANTTRPSWSFCVTWARGAKIRAWLSCAGTGEGGMGLISPRLHCAPETPLQGLSSLFHHRKLRRSSAGGPTASKGPGFPFSSVSAALLEGLISILVAPLRPLPFSPSPLLSASYVLTRVIFNYSFLTSLLCLEPSEIPCPLMPNLSSDPCLQALKSGPMTPTCFSPLVTPVSC